MLMLRRNQSTLAIVLLMVMVFATLSFAVYEPFFKTKLTLFDRFIVLGLLPREGSFATLKIVRELQMQLAPSDEEYKLAGLQDDLLTGGTTATLGWDKVEPKEIIFGEIGKALIVSALEKLDKEEKLTQQHYVVYVKFIIGEEKEIKE